MMQPCLPPWHFSFTLKKITRLLEETIQAGKKGRKGGREDRTKREEESPLENLLSSLGVCGLLNCGLLFKAADFFPPAAGHSFSAFPNSMSL